MSGRRRIVSVAVALTAAIALAGPALADGAAIGSAAGTSLVRGGAALPHFDSSFPIDTARSNSAPLLDENLEVSLSSPDHGVLRFLFSPRMVAGDTSGYGPTVTGNYVGLGWNIFDDNGLFGSVALTGSVNRQALDAPAPRLYGPLMSMHSTLELGFAFNAQQSLSLALDHASPTPYFGDYLRLRYGYHF
jgi:hypothetical protein